LNGNKYKPIIEQFERAESPEDQIECLFTMVKMMAMNLCKLWKATIGIGIAILLAILFSDQVSLTKIVGFVFGIF